MKIVIASDHGGFSLKEELKTTLKELNIEFEDYGCYTHDSVDYPDYAHKVCNAILNGLFDKGILICGSGIGMSITANRYKGIRAALCTDSYMAKMTRAHNDANVLCLGARVIGTGVAKDIIETFFKTEFEKGRHIQRLQKIEK